MVRAYSTNARETRLQCRGSPYIGLGGVPAWSHPRGDCLSQAPWAGRSCARAARATLLAPIARCRLVCGAALCQECAELTLGVPWWAWGGAGKRCKWLIHKPLELPAAAL